MSTASDTYSEYLYNHQRESLLWSENSITSWMLDRMTNLACACNLVCSKLYKLTETDKARIFYNAGLLLTIHNNLNSSICGTYDEFKVSSLVEQMGYSARARRKTNENLDKFIDLNQKEFEDRYKILWEYFDSGMKYYPCNRSGLMSYANNVHGFSSIMTPIRPKPKSVICVNESNDSFSVTVVSKDDLWKNASVMLCECLYKDDAMWKKVNDMAEEWRKKKKEDKEKKAKAILLEKYPDDCVKNADMLDFDPEWLLRKCEARERS